MEGGRTVIVREPEIRVNERIRAREVRVIASDGKQLGVIPVREALKMAEELGFDLVEVAPNAMPPVCRLMDYGKYKYELKKQAVAKKQKVQLVKEVNFRPNIGEHDLDVKINRIREFLEDGHKSKVRISFRGREITHPELGKELAEKIIERIIDIGLIDALPKFEGKSLIMVIAPKKK
ncbi:MAG: translation initiation factor IF-3 [Candidatus Dadabacteria bacterium]|nr:translation initiation factor IF-3 [Candidatus Dadabacteria bacterium]